MIPSSRNRATTANRYTEGFRPSEKSARRRNKRAALVARLWKLQTEFDIRRAESLAGGEAFADDAEAEAVRDAWGRIVCCGKTPHVRYLDGVPESPLRQCGDHGTYYRTLGCNHALCPVCQRKRANKLLESYGNQLSGVMATMTQPARSEESAKESYKRFRGGWRRFLQELDRPLFAPWAAPRWGKAVGPSASAAQLMGLDLSEEKLGGLLSVEWKERPDGWHVHGHVLLNRRVESWAFRLCWALAHFDRRTRAGRRSALVLYRAAAAGVAASKRKRSAPREARQALADREGWLLRFWARACAQVIGRDGRMGSVPSIVDVRIPRGGIAEGLKYACKGPAYNYDPELDSGLSDAQLIDLLVTLPNLRRSSAFGVVEKIDEEELEGYEEHCPICEGPVAIVDGQELSDHVYSRIPPAWELRELGQKLREARRDVEEAKGEALARLALLSVSAVEDVAFGFLPNPLARRVRLLPAPQRGLVRLQPSLRTGRMLWGGLLGRA
mgnify:CR=1 FL=1